MIFGRYGTQFESIDVSADTETIGVARIGR